MSDIISKIRLKQQDNNVHVNVLILRTFYWFVMDSLIVTTPQRFKIKVKHIRKVQFKTTKGIQDPPPG